MNKIKDKKILYISLITVVFLIVFACIVSITYSFFSVTKTENETINGTAAGFNPSEEEGEETLKIELISEDATGGLVPQLSDTTYLSQAIIGTNNQQCVDGNGNTVCQIYKITINNNTGTNLNVGLTLSLIGETTDLKWEVMSSSNALNSPRLTHAVSNKNIETDLLLDNGSSKSYYILIWFEETGKEQTKLSTDAFSGVVSLEGANGNISILLNDSIYKRLSYLESSGTQYIDTGYKVNNNEKWIIKLSDDADEVGGHYMGINDSANKCSIATYEKEVKNDKNETTGTLAIVTPNVVGLNVLTSQNWNNGEHKYTLDLSQKKFYQDETAYSLSGTLGTLPNKNIWIFGDGLSFLTGKVYYSKIYDNNILVRNYIPVQRVSDDKPGLFDLVNEVFYTNVGEGEFAVGEIEN